MSVGGVMQGQSARVGSLSLGAAEVRDVTTGLSAPQGGAASDTEVAGNIGEGVLRRFDLTFDYTRGRVILEKSKACGWAEDGHAGIALEPEGGGWRIAEAVPDGAAVRAGIREGDRVL